MAALQKVSAYLAAARELLQDTGDAAPERYSDEALVRYLNIAIIEMVRVRPDLCFKWLRTGETIPEYSHTLVGADVDINVRYRNAVLNFIVGMAQVTDNEEAQDTRGVALVARFHQMLTTTAA